MLTIHFSGQTIFSFIHIDDTLGASEEVDEVARGASGMGEDRVGEAGRRASEEQSAGVYVSGFTTGSEQGIEVGFNEELKVVGRMTECD